MRVSRALLLLAILLSFGLEGAAWFQGAAIGQLQAAYPSVGATKAGEPRTFEVEGTERDRGRLRLMDGNRATLRVVDPANGEPGLAVGRRPKLYGRHGPWERFEDPRWLEPRHERTRWAERLLGELNGLQNGGIVGEPRTGLWWSIEDGRFVCREAPSGLVRAAFGPDGLGTVAGGPGFGDLHAVFWSHSSTIEGVVLVHAVAVDPGRRLLVDVRMRSTTGERPPRTPLPLEVAVHPFRAVDAVEGREVRLAALVESRGERLLVDGEGVILARAPRPDDEVALDGWHADAVAHVHSDGPDRLASMLGPYRADTVEAVLATAPVPVDPIEVRLRFRILPAGAEERVAEVHLRPVTLGERLLAGLVLLPDLARPLPMLAASAASEPPATWEELGGWWARSPALAGGRRPVLFALALLVAMGCAVLARRSARRRCRTNAAVRAWIVAVLLLGPLGLLWMRLCLPRTRLEAVADGTRAAHLDTAPAARAPWQAPEPLGIEVHG